MSKEWRASKAVNPVNAEQDPAQIASEARWRSLRLLNGFRLLVVFGLAIGLQLRVGRQGPDSAQLGIIIPVLMLYATTASLFFFGIVWRKPRLSAQLTLQVGLDILFIVFLMHEMGGIRSGLGMLLLPFLAGAGLIARSRMTLFHAALATLALLGEAVHSTLETPAYTVDFMPPVLLCLACFAVAWVSHRLASYAEENRALAERREIDLANLGQLNQRILQDVSDGVLVLDRDGVIHQFNEQIVRLGGPAPQLGMPLAEWSPALAGLVARWRDEDWGKPGLLSWQRKTLRPRFLALGANRGGNVLIYLEDMDRLRREAQQLKLAALGRLTANLAHEIRNPLGAITHAAQLLQEEHHDDPLLARLTRIINENALRLDRMVTDVLELNRRDRVQRRELQLGEWLADFIEEFRQQEGITVALPVGGAALATVRFDPGHLHQVLWNLTRNGWRYCGKQQGSLYFVLGELDGYVVLDVCNDGPAVPADAQHQLFEPFFTTEAKGTGLGLYIAREICAANGAALEYLTPVEGGACFRIVFGVVDAEKNEE
ncbi:sensor histidine kinase [Chitinilyticum litopenaei]|uniref:sensor histidine kinase n=1 Tax=Chitinilyticum litopenaei TaxID=1121276 RepID=UPI00130D71E1|nr:ATP-binding protein [Chitinilyticum litopenaei]